MEPNYLVFKTERLNTKRYEKFEFRYLCEPLFLQCVLSSDMISNLFLTESNTEYQSNIALMIELLL